MNFSLRTVRFLLPLLASVSLLPGQTPPPRSQDYPASIDLTTPNYVLGPEDQVTIKAPLVPELNDRTFRLGQNGSLELPIIGLVQAGGLKVRDLEDLLIGKLKETIRNPQVTVIPLMTRNQPVFFVGSFRTPGMYPLSGNRTLLEFLGWVGGVTPNTARKITITRRSDYSTVTLPGGVVDPVRKTSTLQIPIADGAFAIRPEDDIALAPYDIVTAERADRVYVLGNVGTPRSIELGERSTIYLSQALAEAGGIAPLSVKDRVRVLRLISGTDRRAEIPVDMKQVLQGGQPDMLLQADDVVFVPSSKLALLAPGQGGFGNYLAFIFLGLSRQF